VLAVLAQDDVLGVLGDDLPAAHLHVHHGLGADDLRGGSDQRDPAQALAHVGHFVHDLRDLVAHALFLELVQEVGHHAAGHLVAQDAHIGALVVRAGVGGQFLVDAFEVLGELEQELLAVLGFATRALEHFLHQQGVRLARAVGERSDGAIEDVHAGGDGRVVGRVGQARRVVAVQGQRNLDLGLDGLHEVIGNGSDQKAGHVLDADRICTHLFQLHGHLHEGFHGVDRRNGVGQRALGVAAEFLGGGDGGLEVAGVVEGVEDAQVGHAGVDGALHESANDVVRERGVLNNVLSAQQHLVRGLGRKLLERAKAIEGVFGQVAQAGVDDGSTPGFQCVETHAVEFFDDRQHLGGLHAGGGQRLVAIAQDSLIENDRLRHAYLLRCCPRSNAIGGGVGIWSDSATMKVPKLELLV
jgi:hypothetical protein